MIVLDCPEGKRVYFASDHHLGIPDLEHSHQRERLFVKWLNEIEKDATGLILLGDLFDFWFEYKKVIPKGFVRVLGKLAELSDKGLPIYYFVGNHDLWMEDYFETELGIPVFHKPQKLKIKDKLFLIAHGDGLGPKDKGYKRMKKVFVHPLSKFLFRWLHPDIGIRFAQYLSTQNKIISGDEDIKFLGKDKEWLVQYAYKKLEQEDYNYFVFGHRHMPLDITLNKESRYINIGDWLSHFTYAYFDKDLVLKKYYEDKKSTYQNSN